MSRGNPGTQETQETLTSGEYVGIDGLVGSQETSTDPKKTVKFAPGTKGGEGRPGQSTVEPRPRTDSVVSVQGGAPSTAVEQDSSAPTIAQIAKNFKEDSASRNSILAQFKSQFIGENGALKEGFTLTQIADFASQKLAASEKDSLTYEFLSLLAKPASKENEQNNLDGILRVFNIFQDCANRDLTENEPELVASERVSEFLITISQNSQKLEEGKKSEFEERAFTRLGEIQQEVAQKLSTEQPVNEANKAANNQSEKERDKTKIGEDNKKDIAKMVLGSAAVVALSVTGLGFFAILGAGIYFAYNKMNENKKGKGEVKTKEQIAEEIQSGIEKGVNGSNRAEILKKGLDLMSGAQASKEQEQAQERVLQEEEEAAAEVGKAAGADPAAQAAQAAQNVVEAVAAQVQGRGVEAEATTAVATEAEVAVATAAGEAQAEGGGGGLFAGALNALQGASAMLQQASEGLQGGVNPMQEVVQSSAQGQQATQASAQPATVSAQPSQTPKAAAAAQQETAQGQWAQRFAPKAGVRNEGTTRQQAGSQTESAQEGGAKR